MKKLTKLLLIHWHHYNKELINFEDINFLTGKTATGKSTIIDALQLVILGDTTGSFFNKAANDKSSRTLKSYLFCEEGDDGGAGFRYLRQQRFSSYVVVEFEDTDRHTRFACGLVCDCYIDGSFDHKWFVLNSMGIPEACFIDPKTNAPYSINDLKAYLRNKFGKKAGDFEFLDSNKRYQEVTLGKFGSVKHKYRTLLRKAVPFTPITDIEQFITESICDVRNNIDVDKMQSDIRHYKNLEDDSESIKERIEYLTQIDKHNRDYLRENELYHIQSYVIKRAELDEKDSEKATKLDILTQKEAELVQCEQAIENITLELQHIQEQRSNKDAEYRNSDIKKKKDELELSIDIIEQRINELKEQLIKATLKLQSYGKQWSEGIVNAQLQAVEGFNQYLPVLNELQHLNVKKLMSFDIEMALEALNEVKSRVQTYALELRLRKEQLTEDIKELQQRVTNLEKGIKPYPEKVMALKRLLEKEIFGRFHKAVSVAPLAELLEIKDLTWQNAIEGYLANQRFYLLVPVEYYSFALQVYDQAKKEQGLYDIGLINIEGVRRYYHGAISKNSLAEEIESENKDALLYAQYLLGQVIKCDSLSALSKQRIGITVSCMLYKNFVSRRINPKLYENPFIGRKAMEQLLNNYRKQLAEQKADYAAVVKSFEAADRIAKYNILNSFEAESYAELVKAADNIPAMEKERKQLVKELGSLDLLYLDKLKQEIDSLIAKEHAVTNKKDKYIESRGSLREQVRNLKENILPAIKREIDAITSLLEAEYNEAWRNTIGEARYKEAKKETRVNQTLKSAYERAQKATASRRDNCRSKRTEQRSLYVNKYHMSFDIGREDNSDFDNELTALSEVKLPEYEAKIKDAKEKAYEQFKDDFIAKIKSNIETVKQQVEELNTSLRQSVFGTDKYHFVIKPRAEYQQYYNMITDPMLLDTGGWNLTSEAFNSKYQKEINELFNMLIINETNVSADKREQYEKAIKKFTDYKTYLVFDLIVTNEQGFEQRLSKTILKKSGGETQIPFYIALLASFSQVCRIRSKNQNNTIRLIILDEAFSKMDGERIKESIPLLRRFGLQAIFSAPPEKIPDIAPLTDRNIAVYKNGDYSFTRNFDPKALDEIEALSE